MNRKIRKTFLAFGLMGLMANAAYAHVSLKSSNIFDGSALTKVPTVLEMEFMDQVGLVSFIVLNSDGAKLNKDFHPSKVMSAKYKIPMPSLASGIYKIEWRSISEDGHAMSGSISFAIK